MRLDAKQNALEALNTGRQMAAAEELSRVLFREVLGWLDHKAGYNSVSSLRPLMLIY